MNRSIPDYCARQVIGQGTPAVLPILYITNGFEFSQILGSRKIEPGENFLEPKRSYFSYGRPVHPPDLGQASDFLSFPIFFLFNANSIESPDAIYPFSRSKIFGDKHVNEYFANKQLKFEDFCLGDSFSTLPKFIRTFFGGNKNYLLGEARKGLDFDFEDLIAYTYYQLIRFDFFFLENSRYSDDLRYTAELQVSQTLEVSENNLRAIVMPDVALQDPQVLKTVSGEWKADLLVYHMYRSLPLTNYYLGILGQLSDYYDRSGLLTLTEDEEPRWDVFLCHATEDKDDFARPLAEALTNAGIKVWFDEFTLEMGDGLRESIDYGLANSKYGIVVISPNFFKKTWTQREFSGLLVRESGGNKVILPVWHNISAEEVKAHSPILANEVAAKSSEGMTKVVKDILRVVTKG